MNRSIFSLEALSNYIVLAAFAVLFVLFAVLADNFLTLENLMNVLANKVV